MARTPKTKDLITADELTEAIVTLRVALAVLEDARPIAEQTELSTEYKQSLERSVKSMRTFTDALRIAVEYHRATLPADGEERELRKVLGKTAEKGVAKRKATKRKR